MIIICCVGCSADGSPADAIIKVPQMAESITEGTLKQFSKGEFFWSFWILLPAVLLMRFQASAIMLNATRNWRPSKPTRCVKCFSHAWFTILYG